ncbi:hypothetical protein MUK42_18640 [Musa troglodytarum]|uniref:Uncharacterized protein n=1 Tax=Musa troglodytarum TaxID=320322 RepID=A0A9E7JYB8_9LILI|nr:hypothetical protein MUK42_18640 [Musa troglodytarum]
MFLRRPPDAMGHVVSLTSSHTAMPTRTCRCFLSVDGQRHPKELFWEGHARAIVALVSQHA